MTMFGLSPTQTSISFQSCRTVLLVDFINVNIAFKIVLLSSKQPEIKAFPNPQTTIMAAILNSR